MTDQITIPSSVISHDKCDEALLDNISNDLLKSSNPSTTWQHDKTGKISRIKTKIINCEKVSSTTYYGMETELGSGFNGQVYLLQPEGKEKRKAKAVKVSSNESLLHELKISLLWPLNTVGLMIRPKAHLTTEIGEMLIMHKYDSPLNKIYMTLSSEQKLEALYQVSFGLAMLHSLKITHGDIKIENILYDKLKNRYDLSDFEYSRVNNEEERKYDIKCLMSVIHSILFGSSQTYETSNLKYYQDTLLKIGYSPIVIDLILDILMQDNYSAAEICRQCCIALEKFKN